MTDAQPTGVVEVFADLGCPFTHVGLRRFGERRAELRRTDVHLLVRSWPLEIVNGTPMDPEFIAEEVVDIRGAVAPDLFAGFSASAFPATSIPGLALAGAAYGLGVATGEAVSLELRDLLFEQGVDVSDPAVLDEVAARHGIDRASLGDELVRADHAEGVARGVIGSPHFFTSSGGFFCPALDVHRDAHGHLQIHADPAGFDAFLTACFAEPAT
jgi:predicted DsbA family dithiol-disulfide isomerase